MKIILNTYEQEKIINDWNLTFGIETNSHICEKTELMAYYDITDFGYSKSTDTFWCIGKDEDNQKKFQELLDNSCRKDLNPNAKYFCINDYIGNIVSFNHWNDRCSPVKIYLLDDQSNYPEEYQDYGDAKKASIFYNALYTLLTWED